MPKIEDFGQNCPFWAFWGFSAPWGLPGTRSPRGFYINPSRRGPAVPARGSRDGSAAQARGTPPEEG